VWGKKEATEVPLLIGDASSTNPLVRVASAAELQEQGVLEPAAGAAAPDFRVFILYNPSSEFKSDSDRAALMSVWQSWVRPGMVQVHVVVTIDAADAVQRQWEWGASKLSLVVVPEQETYPPVKFELGLWRKVAQEMARSFTTDTIMVKLDMDSAFNPDQLLRVHSKISESNEYMGRLGYGRNKEYAAQPYCMGFSYLFRAALLPAFISASAADLPSTVVNSDVAVGYVLGIKCESFEEITGAKLVHNMFSVGGNGLITERNLGGKGAGSSKQTLLSAYGAAPTPMIMAVAVHSIKEPLDFFKFCAQVAGGLRPTLPGRHWLRRPVVRDIAHANSLAMWQLFIKEYVAMWQQSCVANVADQIARWQSQLPSCVYPARSSLDFPLTEVHIPTFHHMEVTGRLQPTLQRLQITLKLIEAKRGDTGDEERAGDNGDNGGGAGDQGAGDGTDVIRGIRLYAKLIKEDRKETRAKCLDEVATLMTALKAHDFDAAKCLKEVAAFNKCALRPTTTTLSVGEVGYRRSMVALLTAFIENR
jgi:hypothetical protein